MVARFARTQLAARDSELRNEEGPHARPFVRLDGANLGIEGVLRSLNTTLVCDREPYRDPKAVRTSDASH